MRLKQGMLASFAVMLGLLVGGVTVAKADSAIGETRDITAGDEKIASKGDAEDYAPIYKFSGTYGNLKITRNGTEQKYAGKTLYVQRVIHTKDSAGKTHEYFEVSLDKKGKQSVGYVTWHGVTRVDYGNEVAKYPNDPLVGGQWWRKFPISTNLDNQAEKYHIIIKRDGVAIPKRLRKKFKSRNSYIRFFKYGWQTNLKSFVNRGTSVKKSRHATYLLQGDKIKYTKNGKTYTNYSTTFSDGTIWRYRSEPRDNSSIVWISPMDAGFSPIIFHLRDANKKMIW